MNNILFAGSRLDCVTTVYGSPSEVNFGIDGTYSDAGIYVRNGGVQGLFRDPSSPVLAHYTIEAGNTLYFHAYLSQGQSSANIFFMDASGYRWFQLASGGQLQFNSGTGTAESWTNIGGAYSGSMSNLDIDIKVEIDAGGNHTAMLLFGKVIAEGPVGFNQPLLTGLSGFQLFSSNQGYQDVIFSQILITENQSTIGAHVATVRATGAGTHSDWSGAYTDVNEQTTNTATFNQSVTAGQMQSYPMSNITVPSGLVIASVFTWLVAKNSGAAPNNIASLIRTGAAVDHVSDNLDYLNVGFGAVGARYDVNPDSGLAWTQTDWNAPVELGYVSAT